MEVFVYKQKPADARPYCLPGVKQRRVERDRRAGKIRRGRHEARLLHGVDRRKPEPQKNTPAPMATSEPAPTDQKINPISIDPRNNASVFCVPRVFTMPLATTLPISPTTP